MYVSFYFLFLFLFLFLSLTRAYDTFPIKQTLFGGEITYLSVYTVNKYMLVSAPNIIHFYRWDGNDWVKNMDSLPTKQYHYPQYVANNENQFTSFGGAGSALDTMSVWTFSGGRWHECSHTIPEAASNIMAPEHYSSYGSLFDIQGSIAAFGIPTANDMQGVVHIYKYTACTFVLDRILNPEPTANGHFGSNIIIGTHSLFIRGNKKVYIYSIINGVLSTNPVYTIDPTKHGKPAFDIGQYMWSETSTNHLHVTGNNYYFYCVDASISQGTKWSCVVGEPSQEIQSTYKDYGNEFILEPFKYIEPGTSTPLQTKLISARTKDTNVLTLIVYDDKTYVRTPQIKTIGFGNDDACTGAVDGSFALFFTCPSTTAKNPVLSYVNTKHDPSPITPTAPPTHPPPPYNPYKRGFVDYPDLQPNNFIAVASDGMNLAVSNLNQGAVDEIAIYFYDNNNWKESSLIIPVTGIDDTAYFGKTLVLKGSNLITFSSSNAILMYEKTSDSKWKRCRLELPPVEDNEYDVYNLDMDDKQNIVIATKNSVFVYHYKNGGNCEFTKLYNFQLTSSRVAIHGDRIAVTLIDAIVIYYQGKEEYRIQNTVYKNYEIGTSLAMDQNVLLIGTKLKATDHEAIIKCVYYTTWKCDKLTSYQEYSEYKEMGMDVEIAKPSDYIMYVTSAVSADGNVSLMIFDDQAFSSLPLVIDSEIKAGQVHPWFAVGVFEIYISKLTTITHHRLFRSRKKSIQDDQFSVLHHNSEDTAPPTLPPTTPPPTLPPTTPPPTTKPPTPPPTTHGPTAPPTTHGPTAPPTTAPPSSNAQKILIDMMSVCVYLWYWIF